MRRLAVASLVAIGVLACAPTHHRAPAYRYDPARARDVEDRARAYCAEVWGADALPREPFRTDGCSWWPDGFFTGTTYQACCVDHDIAYWCGGPPALRREADQQLARCVRACQGPVWGALMWTGVRAGGHPWWPVYMRWGFGFPFPASYYGAQTPGSLPEVPDAGEILCREDTP